MNILIIGGTKFLGRHLVKAALAKGHAITIFHRGLTNPGLFAHTSIRETIGDRKKKQDLDKLEAHYDCVIDTCGYEPEDIELSVEALKAKTKNYLFVSTISVYQTKFGVDIDEESALVEQPKAPEAPNYATQKALCESILAKHLDKDKFLIVRPGLIVGPHDPTDRFTYWIRRVRQGGVILAPGNRDRAVQFIDARDLADFLIALAEKQCTGIYNAVGPGLKLTMGTFLDTALETLYGNASVKSGKHLSKPAKLKWVSEENLEQAGITAWMEMPLWLPEASDLQSMMLVSTDKAAQAGLKWRPLAETIAAVNEWDQARGSIALNAGLSAEKEVKALSSC